MRKELARQIRGWSERWHGAKTSDVPEMEHLAVWLEQRIPPDPPELPDEWARPMAEQRRRFAGLVDSVRTPALGAFAERVVSLRGCVGRA